MGFAVRKAVKSDMAAVLGLIQVGLKCKVHFDFQHFSKRSNASRLSFLVLIQFFLCVDQYIQSREKERKREKEFKDHFLFRLCNVLFKVHYFMRVCIMLRQHDCAKTLKINISLTHSSQCIVQMILSLIFEK